MGITGLNHLIDPDGESQDRRNMVPGTPVITRVEFAESEDRNGDMQVNVELDDGFKGVAFAYYSDELTFTKEEILGLTLSQARDLKQKRDIEYLRS